MEEVDLSIGGLALAITRATCEKIDLCCSPMDRSRILGVGEDRAACEANLGAFYGQQLRGALAAVAESRSLFSAEKLAGCLAAYRAAACNAPGFASAGVCGEILSGATADGAACQSSFECTSRWCAAASGGGNACRPRKRDGEACTRSGECASRVCRTTLFAGTCTSQPVEGESCGGDGFWISL